MTSLSVNYPVFSRSSCEIFIAFTEMKFQRVVAPFFSINIGREAFRPSRQFEIHSHAFATFALRKRRFCQEGQKGIWGAGGQTKLTPEEVPVSASSRHPRGWPHPPSAPKPPPGDLIFPSPTRVIPSLQLSLTSPGLPLWQGFDADRRAWGHYEFGGGRDRQRGE